MHVLCLQESPQGGERADLRVRELGEVGAKSLVHFTVENSKKDIGICSGNTVNTVDLIS